VSVENYLFAESHEWANVSDEGGDKVATVGISAHAVEALTDLVYMDLPEVGSAVTAGDSFGEVLPDSLETLNDDPYVQGWIIKVKLSSEDALAKLLDHAAYEKMCTEG